MSGGPWCSCRRAARAWPAAPRRGSGAPCTPSPGRSSCSALPGGPRWPPYASLPSAHRPAVRAEGIGVDTPTHDAAGVDPDHLPVEVLHDLFSSLGTYLGPTTHLDPADPPRRKYVIDHERRPTSLAHIPELLAAGEIVPADVDRAELLVIPERNGHDVRISLRRPSLDGPAA